MEEGQYKAGKTISETEKLQFTMCEICFAAG